MANQYFTASDQIVRHALARAEQVKGEFLSIERAFDKLPDPEAITHGYLNYLIGTGTASAYAAGFALAPSALVNGMSVAVKVPATNTGAATFNLNGLGARAIKRTDGTNPVAGDLQGTIALRFDGTNWVLTSAARTDVTNAAASAAAAAADRALTQTARDNTYTARDAAYGARDAAQAARGDAYTARDTAQVSATNAAASASGAAEDRGLAQTARTDAQTARDKAKDWADKGENLTVETGKYSAKHHALKAAASASAAATDRSTASTKASEAAASATAAAASLDYFDDRYLGGKATEPTLDNDGQALLNGAMFFDTTENASKVWDGTNWRRVDAAATFPNVNGIVNASDEEMNFLVGVTSGIQTQINGKLASGAKAVDSAKLNGQSASWYQQNLESLEVFELGKGLTGDRNSLIDFHSSNAVDYSARIYRNSGVNGDFDIVQTGTGAIDVNGGGDFRRNGSTIWHGGNDGAGSGLEADTLDGLSSSNFVRKSTTIGNENDYILIARNANSPLYVNHYGTTGEIARFYNGSASNSTGGTNQITFGLDGSIDASGGITSGSNIIANGGSFYSDAASGGNAHFWLRDNLNASKGLLFWDRNPDNIELRRYHPNGTVGANLRLESNGKVTVNGGNEVWHSGNDGSGSGLDSDYLRGMHPYDLRRQFNVLDARSASDVPGSTGASNYMPTPGDVIFNKSVVGLFTQDWPGTNWGGILSVSGWSSDYVTWQLAGSADSGINTQDLFHRVGDGATWQGWRKIWTDGNDGSGSGLDADTLDGLSSAYFQQDLEQRSNIELGRGLSGDRGIYLDMHASGTPGAVDYHSRLIRYSGANGTLALIQTGTGVITFSGGSDLTRDGNTIWHQGNDGAGSGLDADTLDGFTMSQFETGSTIAGRTGSGDIYARLFRSTFPDGSITNGAAVLMRNDASDNYLRPVPPANFMAWLNNQFNTRDLLVGTSSLDSGSVHNSKGAVLKADGSNSFSQDGICLNLNRISSTGQILRFRHNLNIIGGVTCTTSSVSYNTSSDYRLKQDVEPLTGATERLMALKPSRFAFTVDPTTKVDGFLAHEAQTVIPEAVTGEKDGVDPETGEAEYQSIDHSKMVPLLTAALQEALTKIAALDARVAQLEGTPA